MGGSLAASLSERLILPDRLIPPLPPTALALLLGQVSAITAPFIRAALIPSVTTTLQPLFFPSLLREGLNFTIMYYASCILF